jgi:hypothetical protein
MTLILPPKLTFAGGNLIKKGYNVIENSERKIGITRIMKQVTDSSHNIILFLKIQQNKCRV